MGVTLVEHTVPDDTESWRLSDYCRDLFPDHLPSRKGVKKAIGKGLILVNGSEATTGYLVKPGDRIALQKAITQPPKPYDAGLEVVLEDEHLAIIHKPAGIDVSGNRHRTVYNGLHILKVSLQVDALEWPQPVHRLDNPTSGLLVVAKTRSVLVELNKLFADRAVKKRYHAVVMGRPAGEGIWDTPIDGKESETHYKTLETSSSMRSGCLSLLELIPQTGRTHQLRIHCSQAGFPILGDKLYGPEGNTLKHKGLFLAATGLSFIYRDKNYEAELEIPNKFGSFMAGEQRRWQKYNQD